VQKQKKERYIEVDIFRSCFEEVAGAMSAESSRSCCDRVSEREREREYVECVCV
jgi:hypothetical protein